MSKISKTTSVLIILIGFSIVLGFLRDTFIAARFGASEASDTFFAATLIMNIFQQVLISGALVPAFLPVFSGLLADKQYEDANIVVSSGINFLAVFLFATTIIIWLNSENIARIIAPGFSSKAILQVSDLLKILSPGIILVGFSGLIGAILNSFDHFVLPALGTGMVSLGVIVMVAFGASHLGIRGLAVGALIGMLIQLLIQFPLLLTKIKYRFVLNYSNPSIKKILYLLIPLFFYLGIAQVSTIVERVFASHLGTGTISWLSYAQKVVSLPNTLFTGAVIVAIFPALSRSSVSVKQDQFREDLHHGIRLISFFVIPVSIFFILASSTIVNILFRHGQFSISDAKSTAALMSIYSIGIYPAALGTVFVRTFHSTQDTKTPLWIGVITTITYVLLAALFSHYFASRGLAFSLSLASIMSMFLLGYVLNKKIKFFQCIWISPLIKILISACIAGAFYWILSIYTIQQFGFGRIIPALIAKLLVCVCVYILCCYLFNVEEVKKSIQESFSIFSKKKEKGGNL